MWRSRIFWRLFLTFTILLAVAISLLGWLLIGRIQSHLLDEIQRSLELKSLLIRDLVVRQSKDEWQETVGRLARETQARITLIAADGVVLADSSEAPEHMENHKDRPEVRQAEADGLGVATRFSGTVHESMTYVARRVDQSNQAIAFVRVALPLTEIQTQVANLRSLIWALAALTAAATMILALMLARRLARPLHELTRGAQEIAAGGYGHKVYLDRQDEIGMLAVSFNDMSQRLAHQFTLLDQDRQQLRAVLGGMVEGVIAVDADGAVLFANERVGRLLEFSVEQAVGRKLWEIVRYRPVQDAVQRVLTQPTHAPEQIDDTEAAGKHLAVHVAPLPGQPIRGAVLVFHDVTELRRLERVRQEFVANVSHELKTPLSVIVACAETLQGGALDDLENRGKFLERIAHQSQRLLALIVDMISLARIESGAEQLDLHPVSLDDAVHACLERHQERAHAKHQRLEAVPPAHPPAGGVFAWADTEAVSHILDNLVDNAIKYTPNDGVIQLHWWAEDSVSCLEVRDTGIGIPATEVPRVFERFYRVDKARSRELGGTGLGLSIVKHFAQAMNGSVRVSSQVGQGSVFTLVLPQPQGSIEPR
jgi:two-component system phosphate regulon sensor histidine kinase PhoR